MNAELSPAEFTLGRSQKQFDHSSPVLWILSHTRGYWPIVVIMILGAFGNAALGAVVPVLTGQAFNAVLSTPAPGTIGKTLLGLAFWIAASQVVRTSLQFGRNFGAEILAQRMERDIRDELYLSLLGKSMTFHSLQSVGETMARATNDVREVNLMFSPGLNLVIGSGMFLLMPIFLAPRYHPSLVIIPILYVLAYFTALGFYLKELDPITGEARRAFGVMNSRLSETLDGIETVKGSAQEANEIEIFKDKTMRVRNAMVRQGYVEARFVPMLLLVLVSTLGFLQAALLLYRGLIHVGDVVAYFTLLQMFGFPTFASLFAYSQVSLGIAGARRILNLINQETELDQNAAGYSEPMRGTVEFRNVSFAYQNTDGAAQGENADYALKISPSGSSLARQSPSLGKPEAARPRWSS